MKFHKQLFHHKPEEGTFGDCYRTTLACILGLEPTDVPHEQRKMGNDEFTAYYKDWLHKRGLHVIPIGFPAESVEAALKAAEWFSDGMPYIFSGMSRTGVNHSTVGQGDRIIHDPSLTDAGIIGPMDNGFYYVELLVRSAEGRKGDRPSRVVARPARSEPAGDSVRAV